MALVCLQGRASATVLTFQNGSYPPLARTRRRFTSHSKSFSGTVATLVAMVSFVVRLSCVCGSNPSRRGRSVAGATDSHAIKLDGWHADADGNALARFATGANPFVEREIIANHRDVLQRFGPIANQGCALHRSRYDAVLDEVRLAGGEDKFAAGDVYLAATEVDGVEAALDGLENVGGNVVAVEHVGVGHARHGDGLIALAAAAAGVGHVHQARAELVGEIAAQDAVLDEHGLLGGVALVVDIERAAPAGHAAVVDDRYFGRRDLLADQAGEGGGLLAVEVGFQAVTDGFVQQHARPAGAEDDLHLTGRSSDGAKLQDGGARGFACEVLGRFVAGEEVECDASAAAAGAACGVDLILCDDGDVEARERLRVAGVGAVGGCDEDAAQLVVDAGADLRNAWVVIAGGLVGALDELELVGDLSVGGDAGDGIERGCANLVKAMHALGLRAVSDERGGTRGFEKTVGAEVVSIGVAGA